MYNSLSCCLSSLFASSSEMALKIKKIMDFLSFLFHWYKCCFKLFHWEHANTMFLLTPATSFSSSLGASLFGFMIFPVAMLAADLKNYRTSTLQNIHKTHHLFSISTESSISHAEFSVLTICREKEKRRHFYKGSKMNSISLTFLKSGKQPKEDEATRRSNLTHPFLVQPLTYIQHIAGTTLDYFV